MSFLTHLIVITPITTVFSNINPQNLSLCFVKLGNQNKKIQKWQANSQNKVTSIIPNQMFSKQGY
jgi:protein involved in sex pheromone biosynthesis